MNLPQNRIIWRWESDPFGVVLPDKDPDGDGIRFSYNLRFPGQYYNRHDEWKPLVGIPPHG